ncbi:NADH pyrophosphatase zinc ribbon domain-containing protein [Paradesulfitobacterium aromaticivorans]
MQKHRSDFCMRGALNVYDRTHQYCSRCGVKTENKIDERAEIVD